MKRFIDCIHVSDRCLAYDIMEALERDGRYSVEYRECIDDARRNDSYHVEIKVLRVERPIPPPIGFSDGESKCEEANTDAEV